MIAIEKVIAILMLLIVLIIGLAVVTSMIQPQGEQLNFENELRNCCQLYNAYGCPDIGSPAYSEIECGDVYTFDELRQKVGHLGNEEIKSFCNCPE